MAQLAISPNLIFQLCSASLHEGKSNFVKFRCYTTYYSVGILERYLKINLYFDYIMVFNPNYRNIFNSFTIGILFVNIFYAFIPQIDLEAIFLIGLLFIFLRVTLKRWKNAKLSSIFITAAIIYFILAIVIRFALGMFEIPTNSFEIGGLIGSLIVSILKQTIAIGFLINGILSLYQRSELKISEKERKNTRSQLFSLKWKLIPIVLFSIVISVIGLFYLIVGVPGLVDIIAHSDLYNQPLTYSLIYFIPVYYFSKFLIFKISAYFLNKK